MNKPMNIGDTIDQIILNERPRTPFLFIWSGVVIIATILVFWMILILNAPEKPCSRARIVSTTKDSTGQEYGLGAGGKVYRSHNGCWVLED